MPRRTASPCSKCSDAPSGLRVCLNGHAWAQQQARQRDTAVEPLDNGLLSCPHPAALQARCNQPGPAHLQACLTKWQARMPGRLTAPDQQAGCESRLSLWQAEFSRLQVFAAPLQGRQGVEAIIRDHLDVGRPDRIQRGFATLAPLDPPQPLPSRCQDALNHLMRILDDRVDQDNIAISLP